MAKLYLKDKEFSQENKAKIVKRFREKLKEIEDSEKSLEYLHNFVIFQIQSQSYIDFNLSDQVSPYLIGQALLKLNRKSVRGLDGVDIYLRFKQGIRVCRAISRRIQRGLYSPSPYRIAEFVKDPSEPSNTRKIGIFSTTEKIIQRILVDILEPIYEPLFLPNSFAYRPGRSTYSAIEYLKETLISNEYRFCIKIDIKKYFDTIDHSYLSRMLNNTIRSQDIKQYIREFLKSSKLEKHQYVENSRGTPQGSILGPILSNIFLHHVLDKPVKSEYPNVEFIRYADDIVFFTKTNEEAKNLYNLILKQLYSYNLSISIKIQQYLFDLEIEEVHFLGFTFKKENGKIQISPNELRIIDKCQKYSNIFLRTLEKYGEYSVIDLREYIGQEIPKSILKASLFKQIDRFKNSLQQYRTATVDQSNILAEIKLLLIELKDQLFRFNISRNRIRTVMRYSETRLLKTVQTEETTV
ncbi:putative group II intron reverse transcriptase/maturase [Leptospira broomii serovar Hurstbridge str. 5399]|uniref:Group II intron reverse transcriptase/maturase n=1 Tax=Leptospira broomii serovar Hurstbridge str. 5399 TaxID=1049789 RepID=T0FE52_9LEPT|nr:reverse transcriptase domain-containing protein [Leptospira broomii]EQA45892.1 putative group II intron reverse transcriptase/maturase [Leptospira broomii serovar Hurstbridge str. 5399]